MAVGDRDQLLASIEPYAHDHEQTQPVGVPLSVGQAHIDVDPINPHVDIVDARQVADRPVGVLGLPRGREPVDRRGRQASVRAEEAHQRRREVTRGQPPQIQDREHLGHLRRLAHVRRQDRRDEPLTLAPVIDARRRNLDRAGRRGDGTLVRVAVADHQPPASSVGVLGVRVQVGAPLGLQRGGDHLPCRQPAQLVQIRAGPSEGLMGRRGVRLLIGVMHYLQHQAYLPRRLQPAIRDQGSRDGTPPSCSERSSTTSTYNSGGRVRAGLRC